MLMEKYTVHRTKSEVGRAMQVMGVIQIEKINSDENEMNLRHMQKL